MLIFNSKESETQKITFLLDQIFFTLQLNN